MSNQEFDITLDVLCGNKLINEFMHCADVFETGKHFVEHKTFTLSITGNPNLNKLCENFKNALENDGKINVIFVAIRDINGDFHPKYNKYIKPNVQTLSMYQNGILGWALFKDVLKTLKYNVETNQHMMVTIVE